jgi:protein involved in polysaccharide export with SLBB domain
LRVAGAVVLIYVVCVFQSCSAQTSDQDGSSPYDQPAWQTSDQGSGQSADQSSDDMDSGQSMDQQDQQGQQDQQYGQQQDQQYGQQQGQGQQYGQQQGQQYGQQQGQQWGGGQNSQMGRTPGQQGGQPGNMQPGQTQNQRPVQNLEETTKQRRMTAEQIISLLEQEPGILAMVKGQLARELRVDPSAVSDESVYERIRQDISLRDNITKLLVLLGYTADLEALNPDFSSSEEGQQAKPETPGLREGRTVEAPLYENPNDPQVQHRLSPYRNMPSLANLYSQFPNIETKLRRFGSEAFLIGTGNANQLPMDMPAGPDYVLGPGDGLSVNMWGAQSSSLKRVIDRQGQIELPEVGTIPIDGMTIAQAQSAIQKALDTQFHGQHVEISLGRLRSVRVYVVGDVQRPGAFDVSSLATPLSALYEAGGPTSRGSLRILRQYRDGKLVRQIDLYDFLLRGVRSNDDRLLPGDTVLVPPVGAQVAVEGAVRRPAIYELNGEQGLDQVLDLAGGVLVSGSLKQIDVTRIDAHQRRDMFSLQLPAKPDEANRQLASFKVKDGDDVTIKQILPYNSEAVYLEGHVYHPGKYPYREGMTLADLLHSYQDLLPEPSSHAEIVRLRAPDYRPEIINFDLADVLMGNDSIPLQPLDLVRIYGRYEIDSPRVEVKGEVLRPGKYPMSQGMTVADLVSMAGGFRRSAYRDKVDLSSYVITNGQNVQVNHHDVDIQKALAGDQSADVLLKPGDVVSVRRISGWQDIGATVTLYGEVEHAGSYGIQDGERLSDVLKRAGGFRKDAYPYAAVLQRLQVRELNEQARMAMIRRIEETPVSFKPSLAADGPTNQQVQDSLQQQRQQILANLRSNPASGRLVINISSDISKWENTPADIELRAGDTLFIPKKPNFVMTSGQVYNPVAISYAPGKRLSWYFKKAGGPTSSADKKRMYVLRADGSVVPKDGNWLGSGFMDLRMRPGDTIVVPEKIVGASQTWQNLATAAQTLTAVMIPLAVTGVL